MTKRLSDMDVAEQFLRLKGGISEEEILSGGELLAPMVASARRIESRINSGAHMWDFTMICDEEDTFESFYGEDYFQGVSHVPFVVISGNKILYLGPDKDEAWGWFEKTPNSRMERPDSLESLSALLNSDDKVKAQCCGDEAGCFPSEDFTSDPILARGVEVINNALSGMKDIVGKFVSPEVLRQYAEEIKVRNILAGSGEYVTKFGEGLKSEADKVDSTETDKKVRERLVSAGEWFIDLGKKISEKSKTEE